MRKGQLSCSHRSVGKEYHIQIKRSWRIGKTSFSSKRPKSLESQKLSQQILTWGQSAEHVSQIISYAHNQDPMIRKYVAQSLTLMVKKNPDRSALSTVISTLETLSHDSDQGVKAIAQSGLGV